MRPDTARLQVSDLHSRWRTASNKKIKKHEKERKTAKQLAILQVLQKALLLDGKMFESLYEHKMQEHIAYWTEGMRKDKDDFVFVVTENNGYAAMVVITKEEELLINEPARAYLKKVWQKNYDSNV